MKNIEIEKTEVKHAKSADSANPAGQPMQSANVLVDPVRAIIEKNRTLLIGKGFSADTITKVTGVNSKGEKKVVSYGSHTTSYKNIVNKLKELDKL